MMIKKLCLLTSTFCLCCYAYATPSSVQQGAEDYDWQACIHSKADSCINDCATSPDINCSDNCNAIANDKCLSEGLAPAQ